LRLLWLKRSGYSCDGAWPFNQLESQKEAFLPFWTVTVVAALNRIMSFESTGNSVPFHGRSGLVQLNHNHLRCSALLKRSKSKMPRPPNSVGRATDARATLPLNACFLVGIWEVVALRVCLVSRVKNFRVSYWMFHRMLGVFGY
jgi:hypothetical protein